MKFIDMLAVLFLLIVVLVLGHAWVSYKADKVADLNGQYDLRTNVKKDIVDKKTQIKYKPTFESAVKHTE